MYKPLISIVIMLKVVRIQTSYMIHKIDITTPRYPIPAKFESNHMHVKIPIGLSRYDSPVIYRRLQDYAQHAQGEFKRLNLEDNSELENGNTRRDHHDDSVNRRINARLIKGVAQEAERELPDRDGRWYNFDTGKSYDLLDKGREKDQINSRRHNNDDLEVSGRRHLYSTNNRRQNGLGNDSVKKNDEGNNLQNQYGRRHNIESISDDLEDFGRLLQHNTHGSKQGGLILISANFRNGRRRENADNKDTVDSRLQNDAENISNEDNLQGKQGFLPSGSTDLHNQPSRRQTLEYVDNLKNTKRNFQRVKTEGLSYAEAVRESNLLFHLKQLRRGKSRRDDKNDEEELRYDLDDDRLVWNFN